MQDSRDIVDISGLRPPASPPEKADAPTPADPDEGDLADTTPQRDPTGAKRWLGVWFRCCHVYGRMYRAPAGERYVGHCPKCGSEVGARVGEGGTSRRFFEAS